jgi:hypothetical protein
MDEAETDDLAKMSFPKDHRTMIHSNNPIERLNGEIKRRTELVGSRRFLSRQSRPPPADRPLPGARSSSRSIQVRRKMGICE